MGLVQRMNGNNKTFAQLAECVLSMVLYVGVQSGRVDVVFDAYRQPSINDSERLNRGASTTLQYNCLQGGTTCSNGENSCAVHSTRRASSSSWMASGNYSEMLQGRALYVTCEETCFKVTADEWVEVAELQYTQEESDISLTLHAARTCSKAVIVTTEDTDHHNSLMSRCFVFLSNSLCNDSYIRSMGHRTAHDLSRSHTICRDHTRFVEISKLAWSLGNSINDSLFFWATCLYGLWHRERLRQSKKAECPEAHENWHNPPGDV